MSQSLELGKYSRRIARLTTIVNQSRQDYANRYMKRLAFYADAAAKEFHFTVRTLREFMCDKHTSDNPQGRRKTGLVGYVYDTKSGPVVNILLRVDSSEKLDVFWAEPQVLLTLAHELAHIIVARKVFGALYSDHGKTHTETTLKVWKFLLPMMKELRRKDKKLMGDAWIWQSTPEYEFKKLPRKEWKNYTIGLSSWTEYIYWSQHGKPGVVHVTRRSEMKGMIRRNSTSSKPTGSRPRDRIKNGPQERASDCEFCNAIGEKNSDRCGLCGLFQRIADLQDWMDQEGIQLWFPKKHLL